MNVPAVLLVMVTEHDPAVSVQGDPVIVPLVEVKLTVPVGVLAVPGDVSPIVAVQVDAWLITTGEVHPTVVTVDLTVTVIVAVASGLAA